MPTSLLLSFSVNYWQDFQDTLAKALGANIYIFDINGNSFSRFSLPAELCQGINKGMLLTDPNCIRFYKAIFSSLKDHDKFACPYGLPVYAYRLGTYSQKIGFLIVGPGKIGPQTAIENEPALANNANSIYRTINEILKAILERNLLGLRRLELNSIYEISRLLTSVVELEKVLDLVTNSFIIIYQAELCFVGLRENDRIRIAQAKGEHGHLLCGREWPLIQPLMERVFSKTEPSCLSLAELKTLPGFTGLQLSRQAEILFYPLWTSLGAAGLLGIIIPGSLSQDGRRNLQIYANFAAVALANANLIRRLENEARTDFLTESLNRRALREVLVTEIERTKRYSFPLSLIFLDVDDFKSYNDDFGHLAGDVVLKKVAETIKMCIRAMDIVGRYGGEEFIVILPEADREGASNAAERIRKSIEVYPFPHRQVTASIGVASAAENDSVDSLLFKADQACYQAKKQGKNRVCLDLP